MKPHYLLKSAFLFIFLIINVFLILPEGVVAQADTNVEIENPLSTNDFQEFILRIITIIWYIALGVVPIMLMVGGFYFITALGDSTKITTAKTIILWTLIGFLVIISARGMIELFKNIFEIGG